MDNSDSDSGSDIDVDIDGICQKHYLRVLYFRLLCLSSEADAMALQAHFCSESPEVEVDDEFPAEWTSILLRAAMCRLWKSGLVDHAVAATGAEMLYVKAKQGLSYKLLDVSPEFYCVTDRMWHQRCTHVLVSALVDRVPTLDERTTEAAFDGVADMLSERINVIFDEWLDRMGIDLPPERLDPDQADDFTSGIPSAACLFQSGCRQCHRARKIGKTRKRH